MFNITTYQRNVSQNHNEILVYIRVVITKETGENRYWQDCNESETFF